VRSRTWRPRSPSGPFDVRRQHLFVVLAVLDKLDAALVPEPGLRVVEFRVDRRRHRELHTRLRESVAAALA
jgi:hypothetical protein